MNPDYSFLTNWPQCDKATAEVTFRLETFEHRDKGFYLADTRADRSQEAGAEALAKKDEEILDAQRDAAKPGLSPEDQEDANDIVVLLQAQRKKIIRDNRTSAGTERFLDTVNAAQAEGQVTVLTAVLAGITAHRATLTA